MGSLTWTAGVCRSSACAARFSAASAPGGTRPRRAGPRIRAFHCRCGRARSPHFGRWRSASFPTSQLSDFHGFAPSSEARHSPLLDQLRVSLSPAKLHVYTIAHRVAAFVGVVDLRELKHGVSPGPVGVGQPAPRVVERPATQDVGPLRLPVVVLHPLVARLLLVLPLGGKVGMLLEPRLDAVHDLLQRRDRPVDLRVDTR